MPRSLTNPQVSHGVASIAALSRAEFDALIGRPTLPPGGQVTLRRWIKSSGVTLTSRVLFSNCGTGLSAICSALWTGCFTCGVDEKPETVATAQSAAELTGIASRIHFVATSDNKLALDGETFSHVFAATVPSSDQRYELARVLCPGGRLCMLLLEVDQRGHPDEFEEAKSLLGLSLESERLHASAFEPYTLNPIGLDSVEIPHLDLKKYREQCDATIAHFTANTDCARAIATAARDRLVREGECWAQLRSCTKLFLQHWQKTG